MKNIWVFMLLMATAGFCPAQTDSRGIAVTAGDAFLSDTALAGASMGFVVRGAAPGELLSGHNTNLTLVPASAQKLLVSAALLEALGPDHRFITRLIAEGTIDGEGVLHGNLRIMGGGDPALASHRYSQHYGDVTGRMVLAVKQAGITAVNGVVKGDASLFGEPQIPDTWIWEDIGNYYGAPASGLNVYENFYTLTFETDEPGSPARITGINPYMPWLVFENKVTAAADNRDNAYIYGSYLSGKREIRGTLPAHRESFSIKGSIPDPAFMLANHLSEQLLESGLQITGGTQSVFFSEDREQQQVLLEIASPSLRELNRQLLMQSINLYAEAFLLHLAIHEKMQPTVENGCTALADFWESRGMNTKGMFPEDGSGLSRANGITASQLAFVLEFMKSQSAFFGDFRQALPVSGISGNLKSFGPGSPLAGNFAAKSGYMARVMNYAGYLQTASGRELTVVVLVNNYTCSNGRMRELLENFMLEIYHKF
ncbi:MAG: D-alanyl-D-alanine carboxypeptidase/D-alanyl-D-alanine-endopeptidase [Bacteroidales bacterium]